MMTAKPILCGSSSPFLHWPTFACKCRPLLPKFYRINHECTCSYNPLTVGTVEHQIFTFRKYSRIFWRFTNISSKRILQKKDVTQSATLIYHQIRKILMQVFFLFYSSWRISSLEKTHYSPFQSALQIPLSSETISLTWKIQTSIILSRFLTQRIWDAFQ